MRKSNCVSGNTRKNASKFNETPSNSTRSSDRNCAKDNKSNLKTTKISNDEGRSIETSLPKRTSYPPDGFSSVDSLEKNTGKKVAKVTRTGDVEKQKLIVDTPNVKKEIKLKHDKLSLNVNRLSTLRSSHKIKGDKEKGLKSNQIQTSSKVESKEQENLRIKSDKRSSSSLKRKYLDSFGDEMQDEPKTIKKSKKASLSSKTSNSKTRRKSMRLTAKVSNSVSDEVLENTTVRGLGNRNITKRKSDQKENLKMTETSQSRQQEESILLNNLKMKNSNRSSANTTRSSDRNCSGTKTSLPKRISYPPDRLGYEDSFKKNTARKVSKITRNRKKIDVNKMEDVKKEKSEEKEKVITSTPNKKCHVDSPKKNKGNEVAKVTPNRKKINKNKMKDDEKEKPKARKEYSSTFKRYGIYIPTYEDILEKKKEYNEYIEQIERLEKLIKPLPPIEEFDSNETDTNPTTLNCMHLSLDEIAAAFESNLDYLKQIHDGSRYCKRHEQYKKTITGKELTYNTSTIPFVSEHKQLLLRKMCKTFGHSSKLSDYYVKVLLPELCLKIFMDTHNMTYEGASKYLDECPVGMSM